MSAVPDPEVWVTVERSGGFAGLARHWRVEAERERAEVWAELILACPWEAPGTDPAVPPERDEATPRAGRGEADRFQWELCASCRGDTRRAQLADRELTGPWRDLVDAVREADAPTAAGSSPAPASRVAPPEQ